MRLPEDRLPSGRVAFAADRAPMVPAGLAADIATVTGLSDMARPVPHFARSAGATGASTAPAPMPGTTPGSNALTGAHAVPTGSALPIALTASPGTAQPCSAAQSAATRYGAYTPDQLASAYGLTPLYGQGRLGGGVPVAVFELETYYSSDIAAYQACMGTSASVQNVVVNPPDNAVTPYPGLETALDVETVIGLADDAPILVYQTSADTDSSIAQGYQRIADDDIAKAVTTSWGGCEPFTDSSLQLAEAIAFQKMASQGQSVYAASGDTGSEDCFAYGSTALAADDPGTQPDVTSVGGTSLTAIGPGPTETVWNACTNASTACAGNANGAGGGGVSATVPSPSAWQWSSGNRTVPDVAASADPAHGMIVFYGTWTPVGGTSAAAPLWAALTAVVDQGCAAPLGQADPTLYRLARSSSQSFYVITTGNND
ncbi:MAG: S53 family peptidase, partial [Gemmatimonadales bacterium]